MTLGLLSTLPLTGVAVELEQLEVPRTYLKYLPQLYDGANLMESSERCAALVRGSVKVDASEPDHPVFSYTCRDNQGQTYRWLVDGLSLDVLDDTRPAGRISFAELQAEQERLREQARERERAKQAELDRLAQEREALAAEREALELEKQLREYWQQCQQLLRTSTRNMDAVDFTFSGQPAVSDAQGGDGAKKEPDGEKQLAASSDSKGREDARQMYFVMDFDAEDIHHQPLAYRAYCRFTPPEPATVDIHPRKLEQQRAVPSD
ncbi:hypothetical protein [Gilvimarinus xylanilyticus]|uniref:Uncharacterized protein n=1 Tax=Gilvimarinus xylanilyticus TaxID=2944139 RepID=A0A9X2HYB0_9GAMM|nr:hypothetical protein [Gilvimarinus xylanilyticus]MCP8900265.1 hypothetical protein [Gilvimarinus xylanilyticus]